MKRYALTALVLVSSLGTASLGSAQNALLEEPNVTVAATFYGGDPALGADSLANATLNNSPGAVTIPDIEAATYVTLEYEGDAYTFELAWSGENKNTVELLVGESDETMSLGEVVSGLVDEPALLEQLAG